MKPNDILVSVILPVYNTENFVKLAIESVLNQTYENFELIIVNDGSTDNTYDIIAEIKDSRIKFINQDNIGLAATLNKCLNIADGELIARMDADDICESNRLEKQVDYFKKNPNLVLLGSAVRYIDDSGKIIAQSYPILGSNNIKYFLLNKGNVIAHPTAMFKKDAALKAGGYCEIIGQYFEDHDLWVSMKNFGDFENIEIPLLKYRLTSGSISAIKLNDDDFEKNVLNFLYEKSNGKSLEYSFIKQRKTTLSKLSKQHKNDLFNKRIEDIIKSGSKIENILKHIPFLSLRSKLKLLSSIRVKFKT